jgi:methionyl-tRNA synthetase
MAMVGYRPGTTAIIAPPPTPNGDLHVGHISGPYFGADVLRRYLELRGDRVVSALSADLNQTYVVTTAERLGADPVELAHRSHAEVTSTLEAAGIGFDVVGMPDATYTRYVSDWFTRLHAAGAFDLVSRKVPLDVKRGRYLFEAYAAGWCPVCLAGTKGNICEACGNPNDASALFGLHPTGGQPGDPIEYHEVSTLVLDLERRRKPLEHHLREVVPQLRPNLRRLVDEMFSRPLPAFPIIFPSSWGIPAPFKGCEGSVLNVWAEMVPGHYYWLEQANRRRGGSGPLAGRDDVRYVQFLGFDNSFFYAFGHLALALAAREAGIEALLPSAFVTNEFYLLDNFKFSTSQGHLIWARDFLREVPRDESRFFLALSNPEVQQANFSRSDFEAVVGKEFRAPLSTLLDGLRSFVPDEPATAETPIAAALLARFEQAYDPELPSLRLAAQTFASGLDVAVELLRRGDRRTARSVAVALAAGAAPLVPETAAELWRALGLAGPVSWPEQDHRAASAIHARA